MSGFCAAFRHLPLFAVKRLRKFVINMQQPIITQIMKTLFQIGCTTEIARALIQVVTDHSID